MLRIDDRGLYSRKVTSLMSGRWSSGRAHYELPLQLRLGPRLGFGLELGLWRLDLDRDVDVRRQELDMIKIGLCKHFPVEWGIRLKIGTVRLRLRLGFRYLGVRVSVRVTVVGSDKVRAWVRAWIWVDVRCYQ